MHRDVKDPVVIQRSTGGSRKERGGIRLPTSSSGPDKCGTQMFLHHLQGVTSSPRNVQKKRQLRVTKPGLSRQKLLRWDKTSTDRLSAAGLSCGQ